MAFKTIETESHIIEVAGGVIELKRMTLSKRRDIYKQLGDLKGDDIVGLCGIFADMISSIDGKSGDIAIQLDSIDDMKDFAAIQKAVMEACKMTQDESKNSDCSPNTTSAVSASEGVAKDVDSETPVSCDESVTYAEPSTDQP